MPPSFLPALLAILCLVLGACGPPCKQNREIHRKLTSVRAEVPSTHALMVIPFDLINQLIESEVADLEPQILPMTDLPGLVPQISASVTLAEMVSAPEGTIGLRATVEFRADKEEFLRVDFMAHVAPTLQGKGADRSLVIPFAGDTVQWLKPSLSPGTTNKLGAAIHQRLPTKVREKTPKILSQIAAKKIIDVLSSRGYSVVRTVLLKRLGKVTRLQFRLPEMPVDTVHVSTAQVGGVKALQVAIHTELPVRPSKSLKPGEIDPNLITVIMSGSTGAELANWAIRSKVAPSRFSRSLRPQKDGLYYPVFDWTDSLQPLQVHLFRRGDWCAYVHAALHPIASINADKLKVTAKDRRLRKYLGPVHLLVGVWLKSLWWYVSDATKKLPNDAQVSVGKRQLHTTLAGIDIGLHNLRAQLLVKLERQ